MANSPCQGDSCRADEPESSKDLSSSPVDDHDGECLHPSPYPSCTFHAQWGRSPRSLQARFIYSALLPLAVPQTSSSSLPGKQGLTHGNKDTTSTKQRRLSLAAIFSWKKLKVSPVITSVISDEVGLVQALQRLDLHSQWSSLPDHLLESIFMLMKDGDTNDWAHVQVTLLFGLNSCMQLHAATIPYRAELVAQACHSPWLSRCCTLQGDVLHALSRCACSQHVMPRSHAI